MIGVSKRAYWDRYGDLWEQNSDGDLFIVWSDDPSVVEILASIEGVDLDRRGAGVRMTDLLAHHFGPLVAVS